MEIDGAAARARHDRGLSRDDAGMGGASASSWLSILGLSLFACRRAPEPPAPASDASATSAASSAAVASASTSPAASPGADAPAPVVAEVGTATLIVQRIDTACSDGDTDHQSFLGNDVLLDIAVDGAKPKKVYAFCPEKVASDGGSEPPRLDMWQACRTFASCAIVAPEGGVGARAEIRCGKETVQIESRPEGTVLRGSFGERVVAKERLRIAPPKKTLRKALIDC